jgi:1-acyl-sn-glycerol-3-phosphate acyltransferase
MRTVSISKFSQRPIDCKNALGYWFWNTVNVVVTATRFAKIEVCGQLPKEGPFIFVANHSSRWDGPLVQRVLNRPSNYMVSPNEIRGLQAAAVLSVGAFPANPRLDLVGFAEDQLKKGQPIVIFPEGNVFYDSTLHPFKQGTAKIALAAANKGLKVPIIPAYISYQNGPDWETSTVRVLIGEPLEIDEFANSQSEGRDAVKKLTSTLQQEITLLKERLAKSTGAFANKLSCSFHSISTCSN